MDTRLLVCANPLMRSTDLERFRPRSSLRISACDLLVLSWIFWELPRSEPFTVPSFFLRFFGLLGFVVGYPFNPLKS